MSGAKELIAIDVLQYLIENPDAQDTVEGITAWWLLRQEVGRRTADVKQALDELVTKEYVLETVGGDLRTYYRVNPRRREEIATLLPAQEDGCEQQKPVPSRTAQGDMQMPVTITNSSRALVTLELNTGQWIHLAPGETSRTLEEFEVRINKYVTKLASRRRIRVTTVSAEKSVTTQEKPAKSYRSKKN